MSLLPLLLLAACTPDPAAGDEPADTADGADTAEGDDTAAADTADSAADTGDTGGGPDTGEDTDTGGPDPEPTWSAQALVEVDDAGGATIEAAAWSPDGALFAVAANRSTYEGMWIAYDATTYQYLAYDQVLHEVTEVGWLPDGTGLAYTGGDSFEVVDPATGQALDSSSLCHGGGVLGFGFSADGTRMVSGGENFYAGGEPEICAFSYPGLGYLDDYDAPESYDCDDAAFTWDGRYTVGLCDEYLEVASFDGAAFTWVDREDLGTSHDGHGGHLVATPLWDDWVFFGASDYDALLAYRPSDQTLAHAFTTTSPVSAVAFSADGALVAVALDDGWVKIYDGLFEERLLVFDAGESVSALAFDPTGTKLITGGASPAFAVWSIVQE